MNVLWILLLVPVTLPAPAAFSGEGPAGQALALVRETYASIEGLKARFVQTDERPGVGVTEREEGVLFFKSPDLMRWDYKGERPHSVVINGSRIWIHTPSRNQVVVRELTPEEMRRGAATLLAGLDGIEKEFAIRTAEEQPEQGLLLDLLPAAAEAMPYKKITVLVSLRLGLIERMSIHHKIGNVTTISFRGIETDRALPDSLFEWSVPEGTDVIVP